MMRHFPIFLDLKDRPVLVIGLAPAAAIKAEQLGRAGARVRRTASFEGIGDAVLVVCADPDPELGTAVATAARARGVPVNVVDRPAQCDFIWPAIVERDPVTIAISTAGTSPVLARRLRTRIETLIPQSFGRLAAFAGAVRARIARAIPESAARRRFWECVLDGRVGELVLAGHEAEAETELNRTLLGSRETGGQVSFVNANPGDPELLTLKALRRLQEADTIVCDRAVDPRILDLARRDSEKVFISGPHDACALLARLVREGKRIVRLKGSEPGYGEREMLAVAGIPFDVVPGIEINPTNFSARETGAA